MPSIPIRLATRGRELFIVLQNIPCRRTSPSDSAFPNARNHQPLVVTAGLALDPPGQVRLVDVLVRALDVGQVGLVPVAPHDPRHQEVVLGASAGHGVLEEAGLVLVAVDGVTQLEQERVLHVAAELLLDDALEVAGVLAVVLVGDGADLVVVAGAEDAADAHLVGAHLALGGRVQGVGVAIHVGLDDGGGVLGALGRQHELEVALRLEAQLALDGGDQVAVEGGAVRGLDGVQVGVAPAQQHVVQHLLLGAGPAHGLEETVHVVQQRTPRERDQALLEPAARLVLEVGDEVPAVVAAEGVVDGVDLKGVLVGELANQGLLVRPEPLHGLSQSVGSRPSIPGDDLRRAVAGRRGRRGEATVAGCGRGAVAAGAGGSAIGSGGAVLSWRGPGRRGMAAVVRVRPTRRRRRRAVGVLGPGWDGRRAIALGWRGLAVGRVRAMGRWRG